MRRSVLRQGFIVLLLGLLCGFGIVAGGAYARGWLGTHLTVMLTAVFILLVGLAWDSLKLSKRQQSVLRFALVFDGHWGLVAGAFATMTRIPGPVTGGGAQPAPGWETSVFFGVFLPVLTILPFVFTGLVVYGLRGVGEPTAGELPR